MTVPLKRGWVKCDCGSAHPGWWSHGMPMTEVQKHVALPKGWRWLRVGERTRPGDVMVRCAREARGPSGCLDEGHHPVRRKKKVRPVTGPPTKTEKASKLKMTQAQLDYEVVKGWRDAALAAREDRMVAFYERLLAALKATR